MESLFNSVGTLKYSTPESGDYKYKLVVEVDPEICKYYRKFVPKWETFNTTRYAPHITVVRKEEPPNLAVWGKYQDQTVDFLYSNIINKGRNGCQKIYGNID